MARKIFVLDTNVLLYDPQSISGFSNHDVVIPLTVLEELDRLKRLPDELGKNSRAVIRYLDSLRTLGSGNLHDGVTLENGSTIRILLHWNVKVFQKLSPTIRDNQIIMAAFSLQEEGKKVIFLSKDFAARIKAEALGLEVRDYESLKISYSTIYKGVRRLEVSKMEVDIFFKDGMLSVSSLDCKPNEYCVLFSPEGSSAIGKYDSINQTVNALVQIPSIWGINPRNVEQRCVMDALLRDDIKLVTLIGPAGTGKTLLALACGLRKVFDERQYNRVLVSRPIVPLGRDIGYLPGTKEEKLFNWMQPIYDNLDILCESSSEEDSRETLKWVLGSNKLEMEAVTYIRGRSLPKMFIIVDEAQNLTPHEIKTIVSRAGEGSKVVLAGDPTQIDNPYLDMNSNGLTFTVGKFTNYPIYGHVFLSKTERSELAALAAEVM